MNSTHDASLPEDANVYERGASLAVEVFVIVIALIACALRILARIITKAGLGWDDWSICLASATTLATVGLLLAADIIDPMGAWIADNPGESYAYTNIDQTYLKFLTIASILYFTISATTKLGILCMYFRIFARDIHFRRSMYVVGFLIAEWWIGTTIAALTNCIPLEWSWRNGLSDPQYCFNYNIFWFAAGVVEVFLDIMILMLPVRAVLQLQLSQSNKIRVIAIFLLGGFTVVTGFIRVVLGYNPNGRVPFHAHAEVWTTIHTGMSIVCACLPICGPLVRKLKHSGLATHLSNISKQLKARVSRTGNRGRYAKALHSPSTSQSSPYTLTKTSNFTQEPISYSDTREMYASAQRELVITDMPYDIESIPEPVWQSPTRQERIYRPSNPSRIPSLVRLTLNLDEHSLGLNALRHETVLLPGG